MAARLLSQEELLRLQMDKMLVSEFKQLRLEKEARKNWDLFYKRNTTKFFKDRHWTKREFEELVGHNQDGEERKVLFEVGCGVGNFLFPLLEGDKSFHFYACDFSERAIQFVQQHSSFDAKRCKAFAADVTEGFGGNVPTSSVDIATMIFVLSAIHPDKMEQALRNILDTLRPGGVLLFRDYGLYDYAMMRFAPGHKLAEHFYVRQDGTRAFYFSTEFLTNLAQRVGFKVVECQYIHRQTANRKEGLCVPRIFVQARFARPDHHNIKALESVDLPNGQSSDCNSAHSISLVTSERVTLPVNGEHLMQNDSLYHHTTGCNYDDVASTRKDHVLGQSDSVESTKILPELSCVESTNILSDLSCVESTNILSELSCVESTNILSDLSCVENTNILSELSCVESTNTLSELSCVESTNILSDLSCVESTNILSELNCENFR